MKYQVSIIFGILCGFLSDIAVSSETLPDAMEGGRFLLSDGLEDISLLFSMKEFKRSIAELNDGGPSQLEKDYLDEVVQELNVMLAIQGSELIVSRIREDSVGFQHIRIWQEIQGLPVWGGRIIIHLYPDGNVFSVRGKLNSTYDGPFEPVITEEMALQAGFERMGMEYDSDLHTDPELSVSGGKLTFEYSLWKRQPEYEKWRLFIDANEGTVERRIRETKDAYCTPCTSDDMCSPFDDPENYGEYCNLDPDPEPNHCEYCKINEKCGVDCVTCGELEYENEPYCGVLLSTEYVCKPNCDELGKIVHPVNCTLTDFEDCLQTGQTGEGNCFVDVPPVVTGCSRTESDAAYYPGNLILYNPQDETDYYSWGIVKRYIDPYPPYNDYYWFYQDTDLWEPSYPEPICDPVAHHKRAAYSCAYNISLAQKYSFEVIGIESYDDNGSFVNIVYDRDTEDYASMCGGGNSFNEEAGATLTFGVGDVGEAICHSACSTDLVGHEYGHQFTDYWTEMSVAENIYRASGESLSDIIGMLIENEYQESGFFCHSNDYYNDLDHPERFKRLPGYSDWLFAEDTIIYHPGSEDPFLNRYAIRDMKEPWNLRSPYQDEDGNPDYSTFGDYYWDFCFEEQYVYPSWYKGWMWCDETQFEDEEEEEAGGESCVYANMNVQNHAFYILSTGGTGENLYAGSADPEVFGEDEVPPEIYEYYYPTIDVGDDYQEAIHEAGEIVIHSIMNGLVSGAQNMVDTANAWYESALMLDDALVAQDADNVRKAWQYVGLLITPQIDFFPGKRIPGNYYNIPAKGRVWHIAPDIARIDLNLKRRDEHDVQIRWCDCSEYSSEEECKQGNCWMDDPITDYLPNFENAGWHLASLNSEEKIAPRIYDSGVTCPEDNTFWPRVDCPTSHPDVGEYWSECAYNERLGLSTYHCSPEVVNYGLEKRKTVYWDWKSEAWWTGSSWGEGGGMMRKEAPAWGFLWARPEIGNWTPGDEPTINQYRKFVFLKPFSTVNPIDRYSVKTIYNIIPSRNTVIATEDDEIKSQLDYISSPTIALYAIPVEHRENIGKFGFNENIVEEDSALGGIIHLLIDRNSAQIGEYGYAKGVEKGSVPSTVGFAAAQYIEKRGTESDGGAGLGNGIAVFGGTKLYGQLTNKLWKGEYGGVDEEGNPYFVWNDKTPSSGETPTPRKGAGLAHDPWNKRLLLYGGQIQNGTVVGDLWSYSLETNEWEELMADIVLPALANFTVVQVGNEIYLVGGENSRGVGNQLIYRLGINTRNAPVTIGSLSNGPGTRRGIAVSGYKGSSARIVIYGGIDQNNVQHNDLWEYDTELQAWSQIVSDCKEKECPPVSGRSFIAVGPQGHEIAVYPTNDPNGAVYYKLKEDVQEWIVDRKIYGAMPLPEVDCDGDGKIDAETSKACRSSEEWYADVGQLACSDTQTGEQECTAREIANMVKIAEWSPDGWEWIIDFAASDEEYDYVLTDGTLYSFDVSEPDTAIYPVDEDAIQIPGNWWWQDDTDWSFHVELANGYLYVGSFSGLHVLSLEDPADPVEIGYMPSHGIVRDIVVAGEIAYLADSDGITIVDIRDPSDPTEIERTCLGTVVKAVEFNERDWKLLVLTPLHLRIFDVLANPAKPEQIETIGLLGLAFWELRTEDRWNYLNGIWTRSLYDDPDDGLQMMGGHDVRDWVQGRELRNGQAERLNMIQNKFEVWGEE